RLQDRRPGGPLLGKGEARGTRPPDHGPRRPHRYFQIHREVRALTRRCAGFTLVEALIASLLMSVLAFGVYQLLSGGNLLVTRTLSVAYGRQAALLFLEQLEQDLAGCTVVPGHRGPPAAISDDGRRLAFYVTDGAASSLQITVCRPVEYALS